jgi:toxin ParE1/3/4
VKPIRYHEAAEDELLNQIGYFEIREPGLGRRFFDEVCRSENLLAEFPVSGAEILPGIRKHVLQKFRYSLIYAVEGDCLLILAVAHHSRRPGYWVGRASRTEGEKGRRP